MGKDAEKTEYAIKQVGDRYYPVIIDRGWPLSPDWCACWYGARGPRGGGGGGSARPGRAASGPDTSFPAG
jgi:hypothetical protein